MTASTDTVSIQLEVRLLWCPKKLRVVAFLPQRKKAQAAMNTVEFCAYTGFALIIDEDAC